MKTLRLKTSTTIAVLIAIASLTWGGQLTEESTLGLLNRRAEAIQNEDMEEIIGTYATNAVISIWFFGVPGSGAECNVQEFAEDFAKDLKCVAFKTEPFKIDIVDGGALVKAETHLSHILGEKRKRIIHWRMEEAFNIALIDGQPKITKERSNIVAQTLGPDELSERIMKLACQEGGIDKETAVKLLEESGCRYKEGDGEKKKTFITAGMQCGDEIAALAVFVPGVQTLHLSGSSITDEGLADIGRIQTLEVLSLMGTGITDTGIARLAGLSILESLSLMAVGITDASLEQIADLPTLKSLTIIGASGVTDAGLLHLSNSVTLEKLMLTINMTDTGLKHLTKIPNLSDLRIGSALITDAGLAYVEKMEKLTAISLNGTEVTYQGTKQLKEKRPKLRIGSASLIEPCADSRRKLEYAKKKWAEKEKKKAGSTPTREDLEPLLKRGGGFESLTCEDGGTFNINPVGVGAECSIHGKTKAQKPTEPLEGLSKEDFDTEGAKVGRWTMDLDAAKKLAAEKQLPILFNFTGSDWCYWCKVMEKNVFTKPEWNSYATHHIVMVLIDFPRDKSAVPEKYRERNNALKNQYGISGYPTFVLLKPDGTNELGRLKAGRDKTPASFIGEVKALLNPEVEK